MKVTTVIRAMALAALLLAGVSVAGVKYVAVVETDVDASSGASDELKPAEIRLITAELRRQATENLPRDRYNVMTSETVQSMGGAVLEECAEENCVIVLGSKIGADYIVRGTISKFGTKLTLSVELYETENGTLVVTSETVRSGNIEELLETGAAACGNMYRKFAGGMTMTAGATKSTGNYKANTYNDNQSGNQYDDFTTSERWKTFGLNILPGGLGSFLIMKDNVGGGILVGTNGIAIVSFAINAMIHMNHDDNFSEDVDRTSVMLFYAALVGAGVFNIVRSITYHKPNPNSTVTSANFNPYDGLKLTILPTESGDYKVYARYDYSF
jgi:hypothetical protein